MYVMVLRVIVCVPLILNVSNILLDARSNWSRNLDLFLKPFFRLNISYENAHVRVMHVCYCTENALVDFSL